MVRGGGGLGEEGEEGFVAVLPVGGFLLVGEA